MHINIRLIITAFIISFGLIPAPSFAQFNSYEDCKANGAGFGPGYCEGVFGVKKSTEKSADEPFLYKNKNINLLQPLDDKTQSLQPEPNIGIFFTYFNLSWPWIIGSAAGIGVLQALVGGIQIMLSGGDSGKREEGKGRILWALAGLLMVGLSGVILETINPTFFVQV